VGAKDIGTGCLHLIADKVPDHAVELPVADGGPEGVF
jgi:hypothetical protein